MARAGQQRLQGQLYSFRRCPYAMRARLALAAAGLEPGSDLELREVALKAKPPELLEASAKGTVPVLVLSDGRVLDESLAIMRWALAQSDPAGWLAGWDDASLQEMDALIAENDGPFKHHLDRFKYPDRYPGEISAPHRLAALAILQAWSDRLARGGWLLGDRPSLADWALLPFVRQFELAEPGVLQSQSGLLPLQHALERFVSSPELRQIMEPPWAQRSAWRSPGWLYHLALRTDWIAAKQAGEYRISTRGRSLEQVGFVHLSAAHQVAATAERFYGDLPAGELLLLSLDPRQLADVRLEPAPGSGELFPHLYGPLPLHAVLLKEAYSR
ncbi:MAG: DUF952 domain-containing protein [Vulcanococcus sp.]